MLDTTSLLPAMGSRRATFLASVCSTVCLLAVVILLPLMHTYIQRVTTIMLTDVELCKACH
jgi:hypothetical protein